MKTFSYVFIELDKFVKNNKKFDLSDISIELEDWLYLLKDSDLNKQYFNKEVQNAVKYINDVKKIYYNSYLKV